MKTQTFAPLAFVAAAEGLSLLAGVDLNLPLGIDVDILAQVGKKPSTGPCDECTNVYHPPHHGVDMDECDNDEDDGWHWVHPGKPHYPEQPEHTWGTSTVTCSETSTIVGCPPHVEYCPGESTVYTTVTEVESTTICPVPVTTDEHYQPPATEPYVPAEPTTSVYYPPVKTTTIPKEDVYPEPTIVPQPPKVHTSVYIPGPPAKTPVYAAPPAKETNIWVPPAVDTPEYPVDTPEKPEVDTPEYPVPAPPAQEYPPVKENPPAEYPDYVAPPAETPVVPIGHDATPSPPVATAGASQTVQRVGVAAFAMLAAALL